MKRLNFYKISLCLIAICLEINPMKLYSSELQVGTLSEGACWFENKEFIKVASFNDKTAYLASRGQIESNLNEFLPEHQKLNDLELTLHCGGYGASLVARVSTDSNTFCIWTKFDKGKLALRSIGIIDDRLKIDRGLCEGHVWGEFLIGVESSDFLNELQSPKWLSMIKEIKLVSNKVYKVKLVKDYEFKESEVASLLEENFTGKNLIRYIEYNNYRHPVGEYLHLGK